MYKRQGAATFASADLENRNGTDYYQVTFTADGQNYAYDIDAVTGVVISGTQNGGTGGGADASGTETAAVGEGKAKEIALNHAGPVSYTHLDVYKRQTHT